MQSLIDLKYVVAALLYSGIGLVVFALAFWVLEMLTPKTSIWREIVEKQNIAFAVFFAAVMLGVAIIIASAIHG